MDFHFFDTSALVKRYYKEAGTETVDELIESGATTVISSLSIIETVSAFRRKYNRGEVTEDEMNALLIRTALTIFQFDRTPSCGRYGNDLEQSVSVSSSTKLSATSS